MFLSANFHHPPILFSLLHAHRYLRARSFSPIARGSSTTQELHESAALRERGRERERQRGKARGSRTVARSSGCTMCRRDREDNKSIISGGREAERAPPRQRALCVIVAPAPGGPVSTPVPSSPMDYHSLVVVVVVVVASFVALVVVPQHHVYYQVSQTFKI